MKLFITVGTYKFDSLVIHLDTVFKNTEHELIFQIGDGIYQPKNFEFMSFTNEFEKYTQWADIIISHAGAGTVYSLLKKEKNLVIVPNLDRVDSHQSEIAQYTAERNFAFQFKDIRSLSSDLTEMINFFENKKVKYEYKAFFKNREITEYLINQ